MWRWKRGDSLENVFLCFLKQGKLRDFSFTFVLSVLGVKFRTLHKPAKGPPLSTSPALPGALMCGNTPWNSDLGLKPKGLLRPSAPLPGRKVLFNVVQ